jgi:hypothetical protein
MNDGKSDKHIITASAIIPARRERVYSLLANYQDGHPRILPRHFSDLVVEQGGVGAGTVIRFQMTLFGRRRNFHAAISEPEPGRVLVETYLEPAGAVTTFSIDQGTAPADSRVTISTVLPVRDGFFGFIEKQVSTLLLRPIYTEVLRNLARVATGPFSG